MVPNQFYNVKGFYQNQGDWNLTAAPIANPGAGSVKEGNSKPPQPLWHSFSEAPDDLPDTPVLLSLFLSGAVNAETKLVGGDMHFHGTVMALACSLPPNADKIEVDFGQIAAKDLYLSGRSQPQAFTIPLHDCNPDVFATISVTFNGTEDANLPDHLALNSGGPGSASGVAIGLVRRTAPPFIWAKAPPDRPLPKAPWRYTF